MNKQPRVWYVHSLAGISAGIASSVIFHPVSLVQTRFQVTAKGSNNIQLGYRYNSIWHAFTTILKEEGFFAFYQGLSPSLVGNAASWGFYFLAYNQAKKYYLESKGKEVNLATIQKMGPLENTVCAILAGWGTSIATNPIWVVKTRMQIQLYQQENKYRGLLHGFKTLWAEEGIRGMYKGLVPSFFGVSHGVVQLVTYEEMGRIIRRYKNSDTLTFYEGAALGAISKVTASISTYPYQVVKARLQMRPINGEVLYTGVIDTVKKTWRSEGFAGFYRGCLLNLLRVTPGSAVTFGVYELVANVLTKHML